MHLPKYRALSDDDRDLVNRIYGHIFDKDSSVSIPAFKSLTRQVTWLNGERPLWSAILKKDVIEQIVRNDDMEKSPEKFVFLTGLIKESGNTVTALPVSKLAVEKTHRMILDPPEVGVKEQWQKAFLESGRASKYPAIRTQVERLGAEFQ